MPVNSYGFDGNIPDDALYGEYDCHMAEWTGHFYPTQDAAQVAANDLEATAIICVLSVGGDNDWLKSEYYEEDDLWMAMERGAAALEAHDG